MDRYLLKDMLAPFFVGVLIFLVLLLGHILYWAMEKVVGGGLPLKETSLFLLYKVPSVAVMAFGVATLLATSLVLSRLARDSELVAFRVAGVSLPRVLQPILGFAAAVSVGAYFINEDFAPNLNHESENIIRKLALHNATPLIESDRYFRVSGDYYFYVRQVDLRTNELHGVMVYQRQPEPTGFPRLVLAKRAYQVKGGWVFEDCNVHEFNADGSFRATGESKRLVINLKDAIEQLWGDQRTPVEMPLKDLEDQIKLFQTTGIDVKAMEVELYQKYSVPAAAFVLALLAAPLSLRWSRAGGFVGLLLTVLLVFLYQGLWSWSRALGVHGYLPPFWAAWSYNFIFAGIGLVLLLIDR